MSKLHVYLSSHDAVASVEMWRVHVHRPSFAFDHASFTT